MCFNAFLYQTTAFSNTPNTSNARIKKGKFWKRTGSVTGIVYTEELWIIDKNKVAQLPTSRSQ